MTRREVVDYRVADVKSFSDLLSRMEQGWGFEAAQLANAHKIILEMVKDKECVKFLSMTANLISTGLRGVIAEMIRKGLCDVIITTGGTFDHDIAKSINKYYRGEFFMNDRDLKKKETHRLGNILIPQESYGLVIESFTMQMLREITREKKSFSSRELAEEVGKRLNDENSILRSAYEKKVPVFTPGIVDSAFGTQLFIYSQTSEFSLNLLKDMKELSDIVFSAKKTGAIILGGGISKHHTIWWNQFKGGLDYVVSLTTAYEFDGSLSGARLEEAITWNKVKENASIALVHVDVTLILPLLLAAVYERIG
ncbi:MAG: deoxyhypusine synthase [Candidatus Hadarchaeum sp.]|uniref:deoxyhypusine synthase n=1 Tax=Candidatus Hadarchaeum sp. TaxID=2883567 RepID=UPI00317957D6